MDVNSFEDKYPGLVGMFIEMQQYENIERTLGRVESSISQFKDDIKEIRQKIDENHEIMEDLQRQRSWLLGWTSAAGGAVVIAAQYLLAKIGIHLS